jgi:hypothetical protein
MDITSPKILKLKGALFLLLGLMAAALVLIPNFSWTGLMLMSIAIWAFCRAYYFCFYVMHHYVDRNFRYAGLLDLLKYLAGRKRADGGGKSDIKF